MTSARQEFEHAVAEQLAALAAGITSTRQAQAAITASGQQLAAAYTGAVLATVGAGQDEEGPVFYAAHAVTAGRLALARVPRQEAAR